MGLVILASAAGLAWSSLVQYRHFRELQFQQGPHEGNQMPRDAAMNPWKSTNDSETVCDDILAAGERLIAALEAEEILCSRLGEQPPDAPTNRKQTWARTDMSADRYNTLCKRAHTPSS